MSQSDEELLSLAAGGDPNALTELLEVHGPAVRQHLHGSVPSRWQSVLSEDDVMQQTYADAFLDIAGFQPRDDGTFSGWLVTIAEHNLRDAIKLLDRDVRGGDWRKVERSMSTLLDDLSSATPCRQASRNEALAALQKAFDRLGDPYRQVIRMYDLDGHSVEEVAAALGRSAGAVFMLRARAHKRLVELMGSASNY